MPYAFLPTDDSVAEAAARVAREEAEGALRAARGDGPLGPRVHEMRKAVKKLRGLLRLLRPVMPGARAEDAALRDAGRVLASLRDAAVVLATAERASQGMPEGRRGVLLSPFRRAAEAAAGASGADLGAFAGAMEGLVGRIPGWRVERDGWKALAPGLRATWGAARAALREARADPAPEALHEWRKRVKDHWYQARLLAPMWPEMMAAQVAAADDLGERLGRANDLAVLRERLDGAGLDGALRDEAALAVAALYGEEVAAAFPLGERLLAERPRALARRWGAWWALRGG